MSTRAAVLSAFVAYSKNFEGCLPFPYLDVKRLVTVGIGELENDIHDFFALPFTIDGRPALTAEKSYGYSQLRNCGLDPRKGGVQYENVTRLRLSDAAITTLTSMKLSQNERVIEAFIPEFYILCSDAQLAIHSMSWALGAACWPKWPKLTAAIRSGAWDVANQQCQPSDAEMAVQNDSFHKRVASWHTLFSNAGVVAAQQIDPEALQYPTVLAA